MEMAFPRTFAVTIITFLFSGAYPLRACDVETRFGSGGSVRDVYLDAIYGAEYEIRVVMDRFTDYKLADALIYAAKYGREVYVIIGGDRKNLLKGAVMNEYLSANGVSVRLHRSAFGLFDRFALIDGETVIAGSYPFLDEAPSSPLSDAVVVRDPDVARLYKDHFDYIWNLTE